MQQVCTTIAALRLDECTNLHYQGEPQTHPHTVSLHTHLHLRHSKQLLSLGGPIVTGQVMSTVHLHQASVPHPCQVMHTHQQSQTQTLVTSASPCKHHTASGQHTKVLCIYQCSHLQSQSIHTFGHKEQQGTWDTMLLHMLSHTGVHVCRCGMQFVPFQRQWQLGTHWLGQHVP